MEKSKKHRKKGRPGQGINESASLVDTHQSQHLHTVQTIILCKKSHVTNKTKSMPNISQLGLTVVVKVGNITCFMFFSNDNSKI